MVLTDAEKAAMKELVAERKRDSKRGKKDKRAEGLADVLAKIGEMPEPDRSVAAQVHEIVSATAPDLVPRTWYGMPAYTNADGKVVVFFKPATKFGSRYNTLGFEDAANLDTGAMWPTSYAITELTDADAKKIATLVKKAARP
jgi:uncharacterized protein YdhG (YjbR/CyaY superfamily)